jgi:hypothetical protein
MMRVISEILRTCMKAQFLLVAFVLTACASAEWRQNGVYDELWEGTKLSGVFCSDQCLADAYKAIDAKNWPAAEALIYHTHSDWGHNAWFEANGRKYYLRRQKAKSQLEVYLLQPAMLRAHLYYFEKLGSPLAARIKQDIADVPRRNREIASSRGITYSGREEDVLAASTAHDQAQDAAIFRSILGAALTGAQLGRSGAGLQGFAQEANNLIVQNSQAAPPSATAPIADPVAANCRSNFMHLADRLPRCSKSPKLLDIRDKILATDLGAEIRRLKGEGMTLAQIVEKQSEAGKQAEAAMAQNERAAMEMAASSPQLRSRMERIKSAPLACDADEGQFGASNNAFSAWVLSYMLATSAREGAELASCWAQAEATEQAATPVFRGAGQSPTRNLGPQAPPLQSVRQPGGGSTGSGADCQATEAVFTCPRGKPCVKRCLR